MEKYVRPLMINSHYPSGFFDDFDYKQAVEFSLTLDFDTAMRFFSELAARYFMRYEGKEKEDIESHIMASILRYE